MKTNSAAFQKLAKLEINEDESPDDIQNSGLLEDLSEIITNLHSAMCSAKVLSYSSPPINKNLAESVYYLKFLVTSLTKIFEYTESPEYKIPEIEKNPSTFSALKKMMRHPPDGIYLKENECKEICSLLIGNIRDVEVNILKDKFMKSQQVIVKYGKTILELRHKLEAKQKELDMIYDNIDELNFEISKSLVFKYKSPIEEKKNKFSVESTCNSINLNV